MQWIGEDGVAVSDDHGRLDLPVIHRWLSEESYWAVGRSMGLVTKSVDRSLCLGCFSPDGVQVGFAGG